MQTPSCRAPGGRSGRESSFKRGPALLQSSEKCFAACRPLLCTREISLCRKETGRARSLLSFQAFLYISLFVRKQFIFLESNDTYKSFGNQIFLSSLLSPSFSLSFSPLGLLGRCRIIIIIIIIRICNKKINKSPLPSPLPPEIHHLLICKASSYV